MALESAANGKAAGIDGIPVEFFKFAAPAKHELTHGIAEHLTHLLNRVLNDHYLNNTASALIPVRKPKGSASKLDDHRGIAVGSALSKLYSMILLKRLDKWAEQQGQRAKGQAGFRNGRGTLDNAFVLNHLIEKYRVNKKPLYAAFIDFRKAYDCIDRNLLWESLRGMGIHGRILDSLIEMYREVKMAVRIGGQIGPTFEANMGVKQGDPLSPLLFGLFIDRIEKTFANFLPEGGVQMGCLLVQVLLYADDLVLLAETPAELQRLLDLLDKFCVCNSLTVNVKKSEAVIFNPKHHSGEVQWLFRGQPLVISPDFVYLGLLFDGEKGLGKCIDRNNAKGDGARFAMIRRCYQLGIHNVALKMHLFDALVKPVVNYGCELWGPGHLHLGNSFMGGVRGEVEKTHTAFLRSILGVRRSTPTAALMEELRREPLAFSWLRQTVSFWNRIMTRGDDDIVKVALLENADMARSGSNCWARQLHKCIRRDTGIDILNTAAGTALDVTGIMNMVAAELQRSYATDMPMMEAADTASLVRRVPDDVAGRPIKGFKYHTYSRWFSTQHTDRMTTFWHNLSRFKLIQIVAQFRLGAHWLNIESGRFNKQPRSARLCSCCSMLDREDELHMLSCPLYYFTRVDHVNLFTEFPGQSGKGIPLSINLNQITDDEVCGFMNPPMFGNQEQYRTFWQDFAHFLATCKLKRSVYIEACLRQGLNTLEHSLPDCLSP